MDSPPDAPTTCTNDLSNVHAADFHIAFSLKTTQTGTVSLVDQRGVCGRSGVYWDVRLYTGHVRVETYDGTNLLDLTSTGPAVDDGHVHAIMVQRTAGKVAISIDGTAAGSLAMAASFGTLPALKSGTDICDGHSGQVALTGMLTGLCISSP
jgi:hypothetical protein